MADECELMIETELPIPFTKSTSEAMEQGSIQRMTDGMVATIGTGDGDICAGIVHTGGPVRHMGRTFRRRP